MVMRGSRGEEQTLEWLRLAGFCTAGGVVLDSRVEGKVNETLVEGVLGPEPLAAALDAVLTLSVLSRRLLWYCAG